MKQLEMNLKSVRYSDIRVTVVDSEVSHPKLVIFVHGFKADRFEGGRFLTVGKSLAEHGVNSIYMDFPGCNESTEDFIHYCVTNCLDDIETCYQYMLQTYDIDTAHLGMVGYSMGGRLTSLFTKKHPEFKTIGLWAAASYNEYGGATEFLGSSVEGMENQAKEKGYADVINQFDGKMMRMGKQFFVDMRKCRPLDALMEYQGNVIFCHGLEDITVDWHVSEAAYNQMNQVNDKKIVYIEHANHGFGLWDDHMEQSKILTDETTKFFLEHL